MSVSRENLIALRDAVDSVTRLKESFRDDMSWEEKENFKSAMRMKELQSAANISYDAKRFDASLAAEQAGFSSYLSGPDFSTESQFGGETKGVGDWFFSGYGLDDWFGDGDRKEKYDEAMLTFEQNEQLFKGQLRDVVNSWAYFGKEGEGVQEAIEDATTAISTLKEYKKAEAWLGKDKTDNEAIDIKIAEYEGLIKKFNSQPKQFTETIKQRY